MNDFLSLTSPDQLSKGADGHASSQESWAQRVNNLVMALENDKGAMRGGQLARFQQAKSEFFDRFGELSKWCASHGISLGNAHNQAVQTQDLVEGDFSGMASQAGGLSRPVNIPV